MNEVPVCVVVPDPYVCPGDIDRWGIMPWDTSTFLLIRCVAIPEHWQDCNGGSPFYEFCKPYERVCWNCGRGVSHDDSCLGCLGCDASPCCCAKCDDPEASKEIPF